MDREINSYAILKNVDTTPFVAFRAFADYPEIVCGFSTRLGGVSTGEFASMNLGFGRGDDDGRVMENYRRIAGSMGILPGQLIFTDQVHETKLRRADRGDCGKGIFYKRDYSGVDGHATNEPGAALLVFGADCVPIFFYDRTKRAIGAVHAGWRGTAGKIAGGMVDFMKQEFGSLTDDLIVVVGPSIGPECYEVGQEVASAFKEAFGEKICEEDGLENPILKKCPDKEGKYYANLWAANRLALLQAGVLEEHITISGICTMCNKDLFFSHRATGGKRGSMAGIIMLR